MSSSSNLKYLPWFVGRLFLGFIFVFAGYAKLTQPVENFRGLMSEYTVLPSVLIPTIAVVAPWLELIFGAFLMLGFFTRLSSFLLAGASASFIVVLLLSRFVLGTLPESCGCFGDSWLQLSTTQVMILDVINCFIGLGLWRIRSHPWSLDQRFHS